MRTNIRKTALASILSALSVAFIAVGTLLEILDLTVAGVCSFIIYIAVLEMKDKYPILIYITTCILSIIIVPLSSAGLYYMAFFGYYPILRTALEKRSKLLSKIVCFLCFNISMVLLMLLFKSIFALQNEPISVYILLIITANIFYFCLDYAIRVFAFIYFKRIRSKFNFKL